MQVFIYCLKHPITNEIRYIGKTTNYRRRLSAHISDAKKNKGRRHVLNWIYGLLQIGLKPQISIIERCDESVWPDREKYWIGYYRVIIPKLCNICDGGLGGTYTKNFSEEELNTRRIVMSKTMSKFKEEIKLHIWELIKEGKNLSEIQNSYPEYSRQMHFGIINGRQWNSITNLPKTKSSSRKKPYLWKRGLFVVFKKIDGKNKVKFSSRNEQEVIDYLRNGQESY